MHNWGDDFDWDNFYKAIENFKSEFEALSGHTPMVKEKYGTMRFEFECMWLESEQDVRNRDVALLKTVQKYPQFAKELLDEWEV